MRLRAVGLALAIAIGSFAAGGLAFSHQDEDDGAKKFGAPNEHHEALRAWAGSWAVKGKMWTAPNAKPIEWEAKSELKLILGGRFLHESFVASNFGGQSFEGFGILGYDTIRKRYASFWIDNMATGFSTATATLEDGGRRLVETAEMPDPQHGRYQKARFVHERRADDHIIRRMYVADENGDEVKAMELDYRRR